LKQALDHGLRITKIQRVLQFSQEPWLKSYIDLNTAKRQEARNEFEKNLFKVNLRKILIYLHLKDGIWLIIYFSLTIQLMNNAVFRKTMEDVKRRRDVRLLTKWPGR